MPAARRSSPWLALVALLLLAALALFAPAYVRAAQTLAALQAGDEAALAKRVDFEALRADLKGDLGVALDQHFDKAGADRRVKSLGAMIAAPFVAAIVDQFASPEGLAETARAALDAEKDDTGAAPAARSFGDLLGVATARGSFTSPNSFRVALGDPARPTALVFARTAGIDWRLAGLDLPPDLLRPN